KKYLNDGKIVDFYGGTGSIGISLINNKNELKIVELDEHSAQMAKVNIKDLDNAKVFSLSAEESLEKIVSDSVLVVDPPRAGLHKKVVQSICEVKPKQLIYLSCSPVTQARDLKEIIEAGYKIKFARGYNFFPKTPHIESLIILEK
ncbi:MAG TPA: RsmD family RNA methyltransferase, partial [Candidatus Saccharimonadales bacterium]|nr:RsmD family RNA methyltransferase [Candidatus Saccharimonadales bacterium]